MPLITDEVAGQLKEEFARLVHPVRLAVFSQALADPESEQVKRLVEELANVDSRITAQSYNFVLDKEKVESLGIRRRAALGLRVRHARGGHPGRLQRRQRAQRPDAGRAEGDREARPCPGLFHADLTALSPGGPP